ICQEVEAECYAKTGKTIKLHKSTIQRRALGGQRSIWEFNTTKRWLTNAEEKSVVDFAIDTVLRGFPLSHRRLKEHVGEICKGKHSERFPDIGL
ncbi:hypothetical protein C8Q76DRAFT_568097, partial [Earliella scabrosa]